MKRIFCRNCLLLKNKSDVFAALILLDMIDGKTLMSPGSQAKAVPSIYLLIQRIWHDRSKRSRGGASKSSIHVMQVRPLRIVGKHLLPDPCRILMHQRRRVLTDELQHVDEVVVRIDLVQPIGRQQALYNADVPGAQLSPAE